MLAFLSGALISAGVIFLVLMLWIGVQGLYRKTEQLPPDCDVMGDTSRSCTHCNLRNDCDMRRD